MSEACVVLSIGTAGLSIFSKTLICKEQLHVIGINHTWAPPGVF